MIIWALHIRLWLSLKPCIFSIWNCIDRIVLSLVGNISQSILILINSICCWSILVQTVHSAFILYNLLIILIIILNNLWKNDYKPMMNWTVDIMKICMHHNLNTKYSHIYKFKTIWYYMNKSVTSSYPHLHFALHLFGRQQNKRSKSGIRYLESTSDGLVAPDLVRREEMITIHQSIASL